MADDHVLPLSLERDQRGGYTAGTPPQLLVKFAFLMATLSCGVPSPTQKTDITCMAPSYDQLRILSTPWHGPGMVIQLIDITVGHFYSETLLFVDDHTWTRGLGWHETMAMVVGTP